MRKLTTSATLFGKMRNIWKNKCISLKVNMRSYKAIILSTLPHSAATGPLTATLTKRLNAAHHRWQRSIFLRHFLKERVTNEEVRVRSGQHSMDDTLSERRSTPLAWTCDTNGSPAHTSTGVALGGSTGLREVQVVHEQTGGAQSTGTC